MNRKNTFARAGSLLAAAIAVGLLACPSPAQAQFTLYGENRTIILAPPTSAVGNTETVKSNAPVDIHGFTGIATIALMAHTNAPGGTITATLHSSDDQTTWTTGPTYSLASQANIIYTNLYYGTNGLTATNTYLLPGTITTPTAATAGFATPYLDVTANPFTNTGAINVVATAKPITLIAFNVGDAKRYLRVFWTFGGSVTNVAYSAVLTARKQQFPP